jgi:Protein of unknown function (DUF3500)
LASVRNFPFALMRRMLHLRLSSVAFAQKMAKLSKARAFVFVIVKEISMSANQIVHGGRDVALPRGRGIRFLSAMAAFVIVGLAFYASGGVTPRANVVDQDKADDKPSAQTTKAVEAAKTFLTSLDDKGRAKAAFEFKSPKKAGWSNLPVDFVPRNGVRLGDLTKAQRDAAMAVVAAVLSKEGYQKVIDIMNADEDLKVNGGGKGKGKDKDAKGKGGPSFGNDNFYLAIFGAPSLTEPWLVQYGGHHLGINVTIVGKNFGLTPSLTCAQPASFKRDGKTVRPLGPENDKAFALVKTLNDEQRKAATIGEKPGNLVLGPGQDGKEIKAVGVKGSALTDKQQALLLDVAGQWVNIIQEDAAAIRMAEIKAKIADTYFAWSGPTADDSAAYYRITGPTLVVEYAPQGGTNHIHTVIRDQTNDYGQKWLKR